MLNPAIKERIYALEPSYKDFVLSDTPVIVADKFSKTHKLDEVKTAVLENGIMLFLLFFLDKSGLENFFIEECKLNEDDARSLVEDVVMSIPENLRGDQETTYNIINGAKNETVVPNNLTDPNIVASISPIILEKTILTKSVGSTEINTIKNNLESHLNDPNTPVEKKQEWKQWSNDSTIGLQLNLNIK